MFTRTFFRLNFKNDFIIRKECEMKHFYYVYNRAQQKPLHRHKTLESATKEAIRLTKLTNKNFYVLEPVIHVMSNRKGDIYKIDCPDSALNEE